ncbi:hypothetical protein AOQ84DRAFT_392681 [Glonium stellatum]|uniref:Uncharacterized protein n=1 Tax=Glonium stellatum TaxID=574774 RepID=A0A8E2EQ43_9PEZI|nr:hypothetical protein AOQ84DRAFT_392681 [Glonium stellatum]
MLTGGELGTHFSLEKTYLDTSNTERENNRPRIVCMLAGAAGLSCGRAIGSIIIINHHQHYHSSSSSLPTTVVHRPSGWLVFDKCQ